MSSSPTSWINVLGTAVLSALILFHASQVLRYLYATRGQWLQWLQQGSLRSALEGHRSESPKLQQARELMSLRILDRVRVALARVKAISGIIAIACLSRAVIELDLAGPFFIYVSIYYSIVMCLVQWPSLITFRNLKFSYCLVLFLMLFRGAFGIGSTTHVIWGLFPTIFRILGGVAVADSLFTVSMNILFTIVYICVLHAPNNDDSAVVPIMSDDKEVDTMVEIVNVCIVVCVFLALHRSFMSHCLSQAELQTLTRAQEAMLTLLDSQYDAIVQLDWQMLIRTPAHKLAQLLNLPATVGAEAMSQRNLLDFAASDQDREVLMKHLAPEEDENAVDRAPETFHVNLVDASGNALAVRVVLVRFLDSAERVCNVLGVYEVSDARSAPPSSEDDVPLGFDHNQVHALVIGNSQNKSARSASSGGSSGSSCPSSAVGEPVHAHFDALSPALTVLSTCEHWRGVCGWPGEDQVSVLHWLGPRMAPEFRAFLCTHVNAALNGDWSEDSATVTFRKILVTQPDGLAYRARISVTLPDPDEMFNEEEGSYPSTVNIERRRAVRAGSSSASSAALLALPEETPLIKEGSQAVCYEGSQNSARSLSSKGSAAGSRAKSRGTPNSNAKAPATDPLREHNLLHESAWRVTPVLVDTDTVPSPPSGGFSRV